MARTRAKGSKARAKSEVPEATGGEQEPATSATYSARFDDGQRQLLEQAANLQGQSVAHFIRLASLEKAAHVLNTGAPTRFDFHGVAARLAEQLVRPKAHFFGPLREELQEADVESLEDVTVETDSYSSDDLAEIARAIELGGAEFWRMVYAGCISRLAPGSQTLPEPVDPKQFTQSK